MLRKNVISWLALLLLVTSSLLSSSAGDTINEVVASNQRFANDETNISNQHKVDVDAYPYFKESALVSTPLLNNSVCFDIKIVYIISQQYYGIRASQ